MGDHFTDAWAYVFSGNRIEASSGGVGGGGGRIHTITAADIALREQASYRNGWEAGNRKANAEIKALRDLLEYSNEQWRMWRNKAQGFERTQDALKRCHTGKGDGYKFIAFDECSDAPVPQMVQNKGDWKPIDLDRMRHESGVQSDRAASKSLVEQEPWHAGLDPDDP